MNKYIDADKLIAGIKRKIESIENCPFQLASFGEEKKSEGELIAYKDALSLIDSLQQEPPEVDLEKEIENEWRKCHPTDEGMGLESANIVNEQFDTIAKYFYELGRNARKL